MESVAEIFFKYRATVLEMLRLRGYDISSHLIDSISQFYQQFGVTPDLDNIGFRVSRNTHPSDTVQVIFMKRDVYLTIERCRHIYQHRISYPEYPKHLILILDTKVSKPVQHELNSWLIRCEILQIKQLDLLSSFITWRWNRYEVLNHNDAKTVSIHYLLANKPLLPMLKTDPIAVFYGLQQGQIVKIIDTRKPFYSLGHITYCPVV